MCVCVCVCIYYVYVCIYMYIYSIVSSSKLRKVLDQKQGAFTRRMKLFCYGNGVVSFVMYICIYSEAETSWYKKQCSNTSV